MLDFLLFFVFCAYWRLICALSSCNAFRSGAASIRSGMVPGYACPRTVIIAHFSG